MNYLPEQPVKNSDAENVIQQVFKISGVKLTVDDPIVAVLVLQGKNQSSAFIQLQEETQKLLDSVTELKKYREQVLMELMGESKRSFEQTEEKIIGLFNKHLTEFEHSQFHKDIVTSKITLCVMGFVGVIFGVVLRSLF